MNNQSIIRKASGETEPFSEEKLQASLRRTGANDETIAAVVNDVKKELCFAANFYSILRSSTNLA
jgi:transcriptional regulator NrdR family protein